MNHPVLFVMLAIGCAFSIRAGNMAGACYSLVAMLLCFQGGA